MGHPRRITKKYSTPKHPWRAERIKEESDLERRYGLKNKREIWKAQAYLRDIRRQARKLLALRTAQAEVERSQLMGRLIRLGLLKTESNIDDVLVLKSTDILDRRLQSFVYKQGLSTTIKQARQLITHGHIRIRGCKVTSPSYLVMAEEEGGLRLVNPVIVSSAEKSKEEA